MQRAFLHRSGNRRCWAEIRPTRIWNAEKTAIPSRPGSPVRGPAPSKTACAAFTKESRMRFANNNKLHRKSGGACRGEIDLSLPGSRGNVLVVVLHRQRLMIEGR